MTCPLLQQNLQCTGRGGSRHLSCDALSGAEAREGCKGCFHSHQPKPPQVHTTLITARSLSRLGLGALAVYLNPPGAEQTSLAWEQLCRINFWGCRQLFLSSFSAAHTGCKNLPELSYWKRMERMGLKMHPILGSCQQSRIPITSPKDTLSFAKAVMTAKTAASSQTTLAQCQEVHMSRQEGLKSHHAAYSGDFMERLGSYVLLDCLPGKLKHLLGQKHKVATGFGKRSTRAPRFFRCWVFNPKAVQQLQQHRRQCFTYPRVGLANVMVGLIDILNECSHLAKG